MPILNLSGGAPGYRKQGQHDQQDNRQTFKHDWAPERLGIKTAGFITRRAYPDNAFSRETALL
jgi:hypothetical protein